MVEPFVDVSRLVGEFALGHVFGDHQHALGGIVEDVAGLLDVAVSGAEQVEFRLGIRASCSEIGQRYSAGVVL